MPIDLSTRVDFLKQDSREAPTAAKIAEDLSTARPGRLTSALRRQQLDSLLDLERVSAGLPTESRRRGGPAEAEPEYEVILQRSNFLPVAFLDVGRERSRAVCKVKARGTNFRGETGSWEGTAFLVSDSILLTNHHVLNSEAVAKEASAIFGFETAPDGSLRPTKGFDANPKRLFLTSKALDYTFVWLDGEPGREFGHVPLDRMSSTVVENELVNIIQHPSGEPKTLALQENEVTMRDVTVLHYRTDTQPGSSGSPVFNNEWQLVALHHAGPRSGGPNANEGVLLSAIAVDLERRLDDPAEKSVAAELLAHFQGVDELMGFFGGLGRRVNEAHGDLEAVVDRYRGEDQDLDVAFWNVEWFNRRYPDKLAAVGKIVAEMNLDVWCLEESSPEAAEALSEHLSRTYGLDFGWAPSEPDAGTQKQTTTVIWNRKTVTLEAKTWPKEVDAWFHLRSTDVDSDAFEAVEGKVFDRYPGLFYCRSAAKTKDALDFFVVPLHLKAMDEGQKRRRLASRILAAAIFKMIEGKADADWVIGGDFNAELATDDFSALSRRGLRAISAADEQTGALSYIKSPRSLIDHVFLSPNLARTYGEGDYFVVAAERQIPGYVKNVSDHRPVLVRLSAGGTPRGETKAMRGKARKATQKPQHASLQRALAQLFDAPPRRRR